MRGNEPISLTLVRTLRDVSLAAVGRALNPRECEAQEEGAVMMGLGHTFVERMVHENSQLLNPSLIDYRVPVMSDLPVESRSILIENGYGPGPYGAEGIGGERADPDGAGYRQCGRARRASADHGAADDTGTRMAGTA
jgi:hypothetical protein